MKKLSGSPEHDNDVKTSDGLKLYKFKYLWDDTEYVGVMAQDVLKVRPDAVITGEDGYYRVDYSKLGTRMMTADEWYAQQAEKSSSVGAPHSPEPIEDDSDIRLKQDIEQVGYISPEPPVKPQSDIRLKRDIEEVGYISPEPPVKPSDIRLKRDIVEVGFISPEPVDDGNNFISPEPPADE